jgi:hypothetical protein
VNQRRAGWLVTAAAALAAGTGLLAVLALPSSGRGAAPATPSPVLGFGPVETAALAALAGTVVLATWLVHGRHPAGPLLLLSTAPAVAQLAAGAVLGADRSSATRDDGHLLAVGLLALAATVVLGSWHALPAGSVTFERRTRVLVGAFLLMAAGAVAVGSSVAVWVPIDGGPAPVEHLAVPRAWWVGTAVELVSLCPAVVAGTGLLRGAPWAGTAAFASAGCLVLSGLTVAAGAPGWLPSISALAAVVPATLCWLAVVRTGRQHWRDSRAGDTAPVPHPRRPLVPERTAHRSGT